MVRLKAAPSRFGSVPPRLARPVDSSGHSKGDVYRKLYNTKRWYRLRYATFIRDGFTCKMCGLRDLSGSGKGLICDHIKPHRHRDEGLFWDQDNLQTLCASCHSGAKQRQEVRDRMLGF